jgi:hypothetical protein
MNKFAKMSVVGVAALSMLGGGMAYATRYTDRPAVTDHNPVRTGAKAAANDVINITGNSDRKRDINNKINSKIAEKNATFNSKTGKNREAKIIDDKADASVEYKINRKVKSKIREQ